MRIVGHRLSEPPIRERADKHAFALGLALVDAAAGFGWATSTGQRKGVYRFRSFEAMEQHRIDCLAQAMAQRAARRAEGDA
jgi:hypothetical protein